MGARIGLDVTQEEGNPERVEEFPGRLVWDSIFLALQFLQGNQGKDDKVLSEPDHCPGLGAATEGS